MSVLKSIQSLPFVRVAAIGSRTIPGAYKETSDYDYITVGFKDDVISLLVSGGFELESSDLYPESDKFLSYRRDNINFIVCSEDTYYDKYLLSNLVCQYLKVQTREDRVIIFGAIRDGNDYLLDNFLFKEHLHE